MIRAWLLAIAVLAILVSWHGSPASAQPSAEPQLIADLVAANRILYDQGVVDGFGHVSARSAKDPSRFYLARSMAPGLVTADDIMEFDLQGNAVDGKGRTAYLERFIHSAIYAARPDVKAAVHSHSPAVIPFGVTGEQLKPLYHMSSFLGSGAPVWDIRQGAGDTDMLVRSQALGQSLAAKLADKTVVLMRGHGSVAVGDNVHQVVFRAVYTEVNARLQAEAIKLGAVTYLDEREAELSARTNAGVLERAWELWKRKALGTP